MSKHSTSIAKNKNNYHSQFTQLELFPLPKALPKQRQKPQISSIPGVSVRERDRYRVVFGGEILGDRLSLDEAIKLAKRGRK